MTQTTSQSDAAAVAATLSGDREAFRTLVERYQDWLYDLAFRMTGRRQEAEDIVQDAFVRMYSRLDRYDPGSKFSNWAYTVTLNVARDALRRRAVLRFFCLGRPAEDDDGPAEPADGSPSPEQEFEGREALAALRRALPRLSADLCAVFILRHFHHAELDDIARRFGVSKNVVNVRLFRARAKLWELMHEGGEQ